jgi:hypothetical protein
MPFDDHRFDKRVLQRNLLSGAITPEEYERHLKRLKDASKEAAVFEASLVPIKRKIPTRVLDEEDEL